MNKTKCKKLLSFALALVMLIILVPATSAEAAAKKPAISAKSMSIPVGKLSNKTEWFYHKNYTDAYHKGEKLTVKNKVKGAKYTFTSGNSKVAAIAKEGGYLTGVKPGSATITCTQTLKGKKTVVGKCKVTVVKSSVDRGCLPEEFMLGKGTYDPGYTGFLLRYRNPQAKYTFTADKKGLTVKERKYTQAQNQAFARKGEYDKIRPICGSYAYLQEVTATQPGTYTVTVKETYKGKTRKVGSLKFRVYEVETVKEPVEVNVNQEFSLYQGLNYIGSDDDIQMEILEGSEKLEAVEDEDQEDGQQQDYYRAIKDGTVKVKYYNKTTKKDLGEVTFRLMRIACEKIEISEPIETYVGDDDISPRDCLALDPGDTTDEVTFTSKDEKIFQIVKDEDGYIVGRAVSAGKTTVIAKCGDQVAEIPVTVYKDEDAYYDADEDDDEE